ncbi:MAG: hypothetical protein WCJ13_06265 [Coriobacteriia bacterium]
MHLGTESVRIGVLLYGLNVLLASFMLSLIMLYVTRQPDLVTSEIAGEQLRKINRQRWILTVVDLLALAIAFVAPRIAVGFYLLATLLALVLPLFGMRYRSHARWRRRAKKPESPDQGRSRRWGSAKNDVCTTPTRLAIRNARG